MHLKANDHFDISVWHAYNLRVSYYFLFYLLFDCPMTNFEPLLRGAASLLSSTEQSGFWNNWGGGGLENFPKTNNRGGWNNWGRGGGVKNDNFFFGYQCNKEVIQY